MPFVRDDDLIESGRGRVAVSRDMNSRPISHARRRTGALALLLLACLALRVVGLVRPCLSDDEATYCVVGREMLAGHVLYRDIVDHKPPLIYFIYAGAQAIGGPIQGMRLLHLLTALVVLSTALLLGRIARRWPARDRHASDQDGDAVAFAAALLYVVFSTTLFDCDALAANCELFMLLPLVASVAIYLDATVGRLRLWRLAAAGALMALATLFKYQAAVQLPLCALYLAWRQRRHPATAAAPLAALGGAFVAVLAGAVVTAQACGAWAAAWFWFRFNFTYIKEGLRPAELAARALTRASYGVLPALFLWVLGVRRALAAISTSTSVDDPERIDRFLAGWLVASALAVTAGGRFFGHYFHQTTAPLAVLAAPAAVRLARRRPRLVGAVMGVPAAVFFLLGVFHDPMMAAAGDPDPDYRAIAAVIDAHATPTDRVVVWGNAPVLYFEAQRPLGSRFVFSNYLTGLSPATRTQTDPHADASANVVKEGWDMFETDLLERRPRIFVDTSPGNIAAYGKFPPEHYPRLQAILVRDYVPVGEVAGARILALRAP
jgi:hypothetical protein